VMDAALMSDPDRNPQFRRRWTETARPPPKRKRRPGQEAANFESDHRNTASNKPTWSAAQARARRPSARAIRAGVALLAARWSR
jgi:hypothetical protein